MRGIDLLEGKKYKGVQRIIYEKHRQGEILKGGKETFGTNF
jgi:hypothetical protein